MKQEDKELLLKDLCARLPYDVKVRRYVYTTPVDSIQSVELFDPTWLEELYAEEAEFKPYLFPHSSMTEEQNDSWRDAFFPDLMTSTDVNYPESEKYLAASHAKSLEWLYKNHIDIYGFIEKGLAIDATGLNIY